MDLLTRFRALWTSPYKSYYLKARLPGHDAAINRLSISNDGLHLASGGSDEVVKIWDMESLALSRILRDKHQRWGQITTLKWAQESGGEDKFLLVGTARGRLAIYRWSPGERTFQPVVHEPIFPENTAIEDLDIDLSSQALVIGSALGEIRHYKFDKKALSKPYWRFRLKDDNGFSHIPRSIILRDPNEALVFLLESGKLLAINISEGSWKWDKSFDSPIGHASFTLDGRHALIDNMCGGFDVYDTATFTSRRAFEVPGKHNHVKDASFVEGGEVIACPSEKGSVYLFDVNGSDPAQILPHNRGGVRRVTAYDDQERHLVVSASHSSGYDICVWEKLVRKQPSARETKHSTEARGLWALHGLTFVLITLVAYDKWAPLASRVLGKAYIDSGSIPGIVDGTVLGVNLGVNPAATGVHGDLVADPLVTSDPASRVPSLFSSYHGQVEIKRDVAANLLPPSTLHSEAISLASTSLDSLD